LDLQKMGGVMTLLDFTGLSKSLIAILVELLEIVGAY
jgi:hypothetical protein